MTGEASMKASGQIGRELLEDSVSAVKTIRSVRGLVFFFLVLALLVPPASFVGAQFGNLSRAEHGALPASASAQVGEPVNDSGADLEVFQGYVVHHFLESEIHSGMLNHLVTREHFYSRFLLLLLLRIRQESDELVPTQDPHDEGQRIARFGITCQSL